MFLILTFVGGSLVVKVLRKEEIGRKVLVLFTGKVGLNKKCVPIINCLLSPDIHINIVVT